MAELKGVTIIFDLDGTLVDTAPDLVRALNGVIEAEGYAPVPASDVRAMVGRGARALLRRAYARANTALPEPALSARVARFIDVYARDIAANSVPFSGVLDALGTLRAAGATLVVATNKPDVLADALLDALDMTHWFVRSIGSERAPHKKPDPAHLLAAAGTREALNRAVMVGDSATDVAAARAAGVPVYVWAHGYSEIPLEALKADAVFDDFADLAGLIRLALSTAKP